MTNWVSYQADFTVPIYVGCYQIGGPMGLEIKFESRPNWWHRAWSRWLLGWRWIDYAASDSLP